MPVLSYDRPLPPGTVRISRNNTGGVTIAVAPDTAKRTIYTLSQPLIVAAIFCLIPIALLDNRSLPPQVGIILLVMICAAAGASAYRIVARSARPIVFRADPAGIQVINPLDEPADQFYDPAEIIAVQLHRISLLTEPVCYKLELRARAFTHETAQHTLLVSQSAETLDKIGRTLCHALLLPEPDGDLHGWTSYRPPIAQPSASATGRERVRCRPDARPAEARVREARQHRRARGDDPQGP